MKQYLDILNEILTHGVLKKHERTGTGTYSIFGARFEHDLAEGFPLLTTKKMSFKTILREILWMVKGGSNISPLVEKGVHIWDEWPFQKYLRENGLEEAFPKYSPEWKKKKEEFTHRIINDTVFGNTRGDLGPVYGRLWRRWSGDNGSEIDQLGKVIGILKTNPQDRRMVVSAWNPAHIDDVALPPCHILYQFYEANGKLSCQMYQRSVDCFLGLPFNIAQYSLLTMMVAQVCCLKPGRLIMALGDTHLYLNHLDQAKEQLTRQPLPIPSVSINPDIININLFGEDDFKLLRYHSHPKISGEISV